MEEQVHVLVYSPNSYIFDRLIITQNAVVDYNRYYDRLAYPPGDTPEENNLKGKPTCVRLKLNPQGINAYLVSAFVWAMKISSVYRRSALRMLLHFTLEKIPEDKKRVICIRLRTPKHQSLDYKWNERVTQMALERRELDYAMSWLSTLGGAFSALGETFEHCVRLPELLAEMAGKISVSQLRLALRLGDPLLVARCKLWAALSLLQRGHLKVAKTIVKEEYRLAVQEKDIRLQNMCKGVWAKLQYAYKIKRQLGTP